MANNLSLSGNLSADDLNVAGGSFTLGAYPNWSFIYSDGTGGLNVEAAGVGQTDINPSGINTTGEINVNSGSALIYPNGDIHASWFNGLGVNATIGCTAPYFNTTSDRNAKEQFTPVDSREILEQVVSLPISRWNFKTAEKTRHIGPMAQDFYDAFKVGEDDRHITGSDADGIAFAAIQGLYQELKEKEDRIAELEKRLKALEARIQTLGEATARPTATSDH